MSTATKSRRKRRGRGEGSIFQRDDGRWVAILSLGKDGDGKRLRQSIYGATKADVQKELAKLTTESHSGTRVAVDTITVSQALESWLDSLEGTDAIRPTTMVNYRGVVTKHIRPRAIAGKRLQGLTAVDVGRLFSEMAKDGVGQNPRRLAYTVLRLAIAQAVDHGIVARNVLDAVKAPKVTKPTITTLDEQQVGALLAAAKGTWLEALYSLAIASGMRQGEMFGLKWSAIDFAKGTISVNQSLAEANGKLYLGPPKTKAGRRLIELPRHALDALVQHRERQKAAGMEASEYVFVNSYGRLIRRGPYHRSHWKPLIKVAGLPSSTKFHNLRHSHASLCLLAGQSPKAVQERLGHSSAAITMDVYSHCLPAVQTNAAIQLDGIIKRAIKANGCQLAVKAG